MKLPFKLYLITDRNITDDLLHSVEEALKGGLKAVQLREKDMTTRPLLELAEEMRLLTARFGALLFINDRADIALSVGADGVHLGQRSMPPSAVKRLSGSLMVGVSTHSLTEAVSARRDGADFITLGPVYGTSSKLKYGPPIGVSALKAVKTKVKIPVFAIGGINPHNVKEVLRAGADGVAVISGLLQAKDIKARTAEFLGLLK